MLSPLEKTPCGPTARDWQAGIDSPRPTGLPIGPVAASVRARRYRWHDDAGAEHALIPPFFKTLYQRFIRTRGTPREIALGFALGLFIGFSPTMGAQIVIAVFFASLLKWSKITVR